MYSRTGRKTLTTPTGRGYKTHPLCRHPLNIQCFILRASWSALVKYSRPTPHARLPSTLTDAPCGVFYCSLHSGRIRSKCKSQNGRACVAVRVHRAVHHRTCSESRVCAMPRARHAYLICRLPPTGSLLALLHQKWNGECVLGTALLGLAAEYRVRRAVWRRLKR